MWSTASYMRVYWSGAAYFLNVDVALRTRTENPSSLDQVLAEFQRCCLQRPRKWSTTELIRELDKRVSGNVFWREYQKIINSKLFPSVAVTSEHLGIKKQGRELVFAKSGRRSTLRREMMTSPGRRGPDLRSTEPGAANHFRY